MTKFEDRLKKLRRAFDRERAMLMEHSPYIAFDHKYLELDSIEQAYWNLGRAMGLRYALSILGEKLPAEWRDTEVDCDTSW